MKKDNSLENLEIFFEKVKTVGFFERLFSWKNILHLSYDAYEEFKSIDKDYETFSKQIEELLSQKKDLQKDLSYKDIENKKLDNEISGLRERQNSLTEKSDGYLKELTSFREKKTYQDKEFEKRISDFDLRNKQLEDDRIRIDEERQNEILQQQNEMKKTWKEHENRVEKKIREIAERNIIEYFNKDSFPLKGNPDNVIKICDEYIIFDAKSPNGEDLTNFPKYLKDQTEVVKKYTKQNGVKKEIFLVIPSNTLEVIEKYYYNMSDYDVFIIAIDSLEPIILSLKKVEEYENVKELSPDDRDIICRIIGKFAHMTKRRIQVEQYFTNQSLEVLSSCNNIPDELKQKTIEFEKSDKLNPPIEKRAKQISLHELKNTFQLIENEAGAKDIDTTKTEEIEAIPLYKSKKKD